MLVDCTDGVEGGDVVIEDEDTNVAFVFSSTGQILLGSSLSPLFGGVVPFVGLPDIAAR